MKGIDRVNSGKLFPRSEVTNTRGHGFKVRGLSKVQHRCQADAFYTEGGVGLECTAKQGD